MCRVFHLILLLPLFLFSQAQQKWDLERCIQHALENNLQIKQTRLNHQAAKNLQKQSVAGLFPSLNSHASYGFNFGRSVDPTTYSFVNQKIQTSSLSLTGNVTLLNGMSKLNTVKQAKFDVLSAQYAMQDAAGTTALDITQAYLQILLSNEELQKAEARLNLSAQQVAQTEKLVDAGAVPEGNLFDVRAQQAADSLAYVTASNAVELGKLLLALMLQLDNPASFDIEMPEIALTAPAVLSENTSEGIYNTALHNQAAMKSAQYSILSTERRWRATQGLYYPSLAFFYDLRTNYSSKGVRLESETLLDNPTIGYFDNGGFRTYVNSITDLTIPNYVSSPFFTQYSDNVYHSLGFSVVIPIFNGLQTRTAVKNAELQYLRSKYSFKAAQDKLRSDVYVAYADAKAAWQKYNASRNSVSALEKSFEYVQKKFNLGAATALEYSTASTALFSAQSELIKSKYEYIFKLKVLDYYLGNPITLK